MNFATRSAGFQWFFSLLAAFSGFEQQSDRRVVVLLDEPGTSLHGEAQRDLLRFIFEHLGTSRQVIYTTHSQHMVDPARYEKLRAVEDRATRDDQSLGAVVTPVHLSVDRDTILPIEAALAYSISQDLFIGSGRHLLVEGGSDFVYLVEMARYLTAAGRTAVDMVGMTRTTRPLIGLDPRLAILHVGGAERIPAFAALLGPHLKCTILMGWGQDSRDVRRVRSLGSHEIRDRPKLVLYSEVPDTNAGADIENLFHPDDFLRLVNLAYRTALRRSDLPDTADGLVARVEAVLGHELDRGRPASELASHREEFFADAHDETLHRFAALFERLNETLP